MRKFNFVDTTPAHIYEVINDPSDVTLDEIRAIQTTPWAMIKDTTALLPAARAVTLRRHAEPIFVFGHSPGPGLFPKTRLTWFVAKQAYFDLGARGALLARDYLKLVKASWPNTIFQSYSYSSHEDCERWFSLLGFTKKYPYNLPRGCRLFEMDTHPKKVDLADVC